MRKIKVSFTQLILTILFVLCYVLSNILVNKTIQIWTLVATSDLLVFPLTYILSDVFSEVYGYMWSRLTCYLAFLSNAFVTIIVNLALKLPYPEYFEYQSSFENVFANTPRIFVASCLAYIIGDKANDVFFRKLKEKDEDKKFVKRAILSSLVGNVVDTAIFNLIAFAGLWKAWDIIYMGICTVVIKTGYEVLVLPVTNFVVRKVKKIEEDTSV